MTAIPTPVWPIGAALGEGPVWVGGALWFVDIKQHQIHRFFPDKGERRGWSAPEQVGFVMPARGGGFVAGLQSGLHRFDPATGDFTLLAKVEPELPDNRLNDAVVDPAGRLWFGTMDDSERAATGSYHCFHRGTLRRTRLTGIAITNGPAISRDGRTLYWVDTLGRTINACNIGDDGDLSASRLIAAIPAGQGNPDGPTVDAEGCIWVGIYGGWSARRYAPDGALLTEVRFPVANITKIAFGGSDLTTAYATTARHLLSEARLAEQPLAGALFAFDAGVRGLACPLVDV